MSSNKPDPKLSRLCAELERGARRDLRVRRWSRVRGGVLGAALVTVLSTGGAAAAGLFSTSPERVALGMPAGSTIFGNTDPECTLDGDGVTYRCTVNEPLQEELEGSCPSGPPPEPRPASGARGAAPRPNSGDDFFILGVEQAGCERLGGKWIPDEEIDHTGQVEGVAIDGRVAGGCISQDHDGVTWNCYLGKEAVEHGTVSRDLLGEPQPAPTSG